MLKEINGLPETRETNRTGMQRGPLGQQKHLGREQGDEKKRIGDCVTLNI